MKRTGISVWVLTGDKIETAKNIGFSAGLLESDMTQYEIEQETVEEVSQKLKDIKRKI